MNKKQNEAPETYEEINSVVGSEIFRLTSHAKERFKERCEETVDIVNIIRNCVPFGAQKGDGRLYISADNKIVIAGVKDGKHVYIKTVLTIFQAINNMQKLGLFKNNEMQELFALAAEVQRKQSQNATDEPLESHDLRCLAEEHFTKCLTKKERNKILRDKGYDVDGLDGEIYRRYLKHLTQQFNTKLREEYWRSRKNEL